LDNRLKESQSPARMILTVHDELVLEAPKEAVKDTVTLLCDVMENAVKLVVPISVDAKVGQNWAEMEPA
jgi:DNA polymerase I